MKGFRYEQASGTLWIVNGGHDCPFTQGYSGRGAGRDNPALQDQKNVGPLPQGRYRLWLRASDHFASPSFALSQEEGETFGRSGFWIHGDNQARDASRGCIVLDRVSRQCVLALMDLGYTTLWVTP